MRRHGRKMTSENWGHGAAGKGTSGRVEAVRRKERSVLYRFQEEHGPAHILISDLWPPELRDNTFLLFLSHLSVILCFDSSRRLIPYLHVMTNDNNQYLIRGFSL